MVGGRKAFVDKRHHDAIVHEKQKDMLHKLEEFLHAYYDLLDETGGPPDKYRPETAVNEGIEAVEHLWWESLDDDG
jgi:hypothetical protein